MLSLENWTINKEKSFDSHPPFAICYLLITCISIRKSGLSSLILGFPHMIHRMGHLFRKITITCTNIPTHMYLILVILFEKNLP